jgi:bile acid:Na+ symporter, BASS family
MQQSLALSVGLPAVLFVIMLGLGLSLRLDDFTRALSSPKPVLIGLVCHTLLLPILCFGLVYASSMPPAIAVGMMLLAASPGGTSGALYTHLAKGDVALSITLTAVTSILALISLPIIANLSLHFFYGEAETVYLELDKVLQIFGIAIVPAVIGAFIQNRYPATALRLERPVKILATVFLAAVVLFALVGQWRLVATWGPTVGAAALIFNLVTLAVSYYVPLLFGVERSQSIALAMAIGIHNAALVIALAMSEYMLNNSEMAVAPALYGLIAYITAGVFVWALNRRQSAIEPRASRDVQTTA